MNSVEESKKSLGEAMVLLYNKVFCQPMSTFDLMAVQCSNHCAPGDSVDFVVVLRIVDCKCLLARTRLFTFPCIFSPMVSDLTYQGLELSRLG